MRPFGRTLITKGIQALCKGVSISTKGVLDCVRVRVGGGQPYIRPFEITLWLVGKKQFAFEKRYNLVGRELFGLDKKYIIIGKKEFKLNKFYNIKAKVLRSAIYRLLLEGQKKGVFLEDFTVGGRKGYNINTELELAGNKKYNMDLEIAMVGNKSFNYNKEIALVGSKKIEIDKNMEISGKRNIKNILMALFN
jgi:hypothetical protein